MPSFFEQNNRVRLIIRITGILVVIFLFFIINLKIAEKKNSYVYLIEDSNKVCYQIDSVVDTGKKLEIRGWYFQLKKIENKDRELAEGLQWSVGLLELDPLTGIEINNESIQIKMNRELRQDVNSYFLCDRDYSDCGFSGQVEKSKIDMNNGLYQFVIRPDINSPRAIKTNTYLFCGELLHYCPANQQTLFTNGHDIDDVLSKGVCLYSSKEKHCSIYQFDWKLYWIVDNEFDFKEDGTLLQYQLYTTQFDQLPTERTSNGHYWDNLGGFFEEYEITNVFDCGDYRVSVRELPTEYSVSSFDVGYYENGEWVWIVSPLRPYYEFRP